MTWKLLVKYGGRKKVIKIPLHRELLNSEPDKEIQKKSNHFKHHFNNYFISLVVLFNVI